MVWMEPEDRFQNAAMQGIAESWWNYEKLWIDMGMSKVSLTLYYPSKDSHSKQSNSLLDRPPAPKANFVIFNNFIRFKNHEIGSKDTWKK